MTPGQGTLPLSGAVRGTDPQTSRDAAARCATKPQRERILRLLYGMERRASALDSGPAWVTADSLARETPNIHRSIWSTRLAGMERSGLLAKGAPAVARNPDTGQPRKVVTFHLTDAGREAARQLAGER